MPINSREINTAINLAIDELLVEARRWTRRCDDAKRIPECVIEERGPKIFEKHFAPLLSVLDKEESQALAQVEQRGEG